MSGKAARNAKSRKQTILLTDEVILRIVKLCVQEMFPERTGSADPFRKMLEDYYKDGTPIPLYKPYIPLLWDELDKENNEQKKYMMNEVEKWLDIAENLARKIDTDLCDLLGNDSNLDAYYTMLAIQNARNALHNTKEHTL